jgi:large subunit ribosomal protein L28
MSRACEICGRKTTSGQNVPRKGLPKKKGGAGVHIGVRTKRKFHINLHSKRLDIGGAKRKIRICTKCLRNLDKQYTLGKV